MQANIANARQKWANTKLTKTTTFWIVVGAILVTLFLGFSRGGWKTDSAVQKLSDRAAQTAVVARLGTICVAQFNQDAQKDEKLLELKALSSSYQRNSYVAEQGWATMPGEEGPENNVAANCTEQLMSTTE